MPLTAKDHMVAGTANAKQNRVLACVHDVLPESTFEAVDEPRVIEIFNIAEGLVAYFVLSFCLATRR
jgi:hypothetical protein